MFSNRVVASIFRIRTINTSSIIVKLQQVINKRLPVKPSRKVILHTDRGTQFSNLKYHPFLTENKDFDFIVGSMSRANSPKDNAVIERFIRTFKEHKIKGLTFQEQVSSQIEQNPKFRGYRNIFKLYLRSLDLKPNKKSGIRTRTPQSYDLGNSVASKLMIQTQHPKAFSEHYGEDFRHTYINKFKSEANNVISILEEIAQKQAEVVEKTPFDAFEDKLVLKVIDERLKSIYELIYQNPEITAQYIEAAIRPIYDMLESMDDKLNRLLPKAKKAKHVLPLREPINNELFKILLTQQEVKQSISET